MNKIYRKDLFHSFLKSKGTVISIVSLMALGAFALVGLKVMTPNMHKTAENFFEKYNTFDISIISDYGISETDKNILSKIDKKADLEYGYFKDVKLSNTNQSFRIFSNSKNISKYELVSGRMATNSDEICISNINSDKYNIGDFIEFSGNTHNTLRKTKFKIVGFINSSEILSTVNLGKSNSGYGELKGYAIVKEDVFDSKFHTIMRIKYKKLSHISPYSQEYINEIYKNKNELKELLKNQPLKRLDSIKAEIKKDLEKGYDKIKASLKDLERVDIQISNPDITDDIKKELIDKKMFFY